MGAEWFGARTPSGQLPDAAVLAGNVERYFDEVERLSGQTWSQGELEQLGNLLQVLAKAVRIRDHAVAAQLEARMCGCELAAPRLPNGEYDLAKAHVVHGPECRLEKGVRP